MSKEVIMKVPSFSADYPKAPIYVAELIRCKECKKANTEYCSHSYWDDDWGEWRVGYNGDEWFCADGEREGE